MWPRENVETEEERERSGKNIGVEMEQVGV